LAVVFIRRFTSHTTSEKDTASIPSTSAATTSLPSIPEPPATVSVSATKPEPVPTEKLDLLLSIDVALQLIHADRDALKRLETFASYPGWYGTRVRETIEEAFCEMLGVLGSRHLEKGFGM